MPRANRYFLPGYIWHITHRCHKKEFLLKFKKDQNLWLKWLYEAKKRFGLIILNYILTSNHIHMIAEDNGKGDVIPKSMQLVAGRMAQEYNQRKDRNGAFWEDRYHATAIDSDGHLLQCLKYVDLNMVRAGVVGHPKDWQNSGYNEIQNPKQRYKLLDLKRLPILFGFDSLLEFQKHHKLWIDEALKNDRLERDSKWSESIAVDRKSFVEEVHRKLGYKVKGRKVSQIEASYLIKEPIGSYSTFFDGKNVPLRVENTYLWDVTL